MARFESLARELLTVSRDQLQEEERKHKLAKRNRRERNAKHLESNANAERTAKASAAAASSNREILDEKMKLRPLESRSAAV